MSGEEAGAEFRRIAHTQRVLREVLDERMRQVGKGYTAEHDDAHDDEALALAAAFYALPEDRSRALEAARTIWPFASDPNNYGERRRDLVRAAALAIAEIERLDRQLPAPAVESAA